MRDLYVPNIELEKTLLSNYKGFMSIAEIKAMSRAEQLQTMEMLWDVLCHEGDEPDSPAWHQSILAERKDKMEAGGANFLSIDEVKRRASA